jgi:hypothetical protein
VGIIPEAAPHWRFMPAEVAPEQWHDPKFRAHRWPETATPFLFDRSVRELLADLGLPAKPRVLAFRYECAGTTAGLGKVDCCRLEVTSPGAVRVWVNGHVCETVDKHRAARSVYNIPVEPNGAAVAPMVVAIEVTLPEAGGATAEPLLQVRLDGVHADTAVETAGNGAGRPVTRRAAVCDLCADQPSGPACVRACAHDAARRVDGRLALPV